MDSSHDSTTNVWILVDHSSRETAFEAVSKHLVKHGVNTEILTINQALGISAKGALSGSAERLIRGLRVAIRGRQDEDLVGAVQRANPDLIAITNVRYVRALSLLESVSGTDVLQIGVASDFNLSTQWAKSSLRGFVVPHEAFETALVRQGFSKDRILIAGPPIQGEFEAEVDRASARESLKLGDAKVALVRSNAFDITSLEKLVFQATLVDTDVRWVFHHDSDGTVASTLREAASKYGLKANMFGKVDDLQRFIAAADVVVAAPSEPYISEIVALDTPTVFVGPEAEDAHQVEFLVGQQAAGHVQDVLRFGGLFDRFLEQEWLDAAGAASSEIANVDANKAVAEALLSVVQNLDEWRKPVEVTPPETGEDPMPDSDDDSPFESIGGDDAVDTTPSYDGISKAEAKEQLAALILAERDVEKRLGETEKQQNRWRQRLDMAREWGEDDLAAEAEGILRGYLDDGARLQAELRAIVNQKGKLKAAAGGEHRSSFEDDGAKRSELESRFRKMEIDSDLDDLKDRIKRELGD